MNNACPSCGAVYAVAAKDIGRKIKCKKCGSALIVSDAGFVLDVPTASPPPPAAAVAVVAEVEDDFDTGDDDEVVTSRRGKKDKKASGGRGGADLGAIAGKLGGLSGLVEKLGGMSTILFSFGVFLVIFFTFMTKIGEAANQRADAYLSKLEGEMEVKKAGLLKNKSASPKEEDIKKMMDEEKKISEEYLPKLIEAEQDAKATHTSNIRGKWSDRWGTMIGFVFVAFGCIGYLRTEQPPLVLRIVAAVILSVMMIVVFSSYSGSDSGSSSSPSSTGSSTPKGGKQGVGLGMPPGNQ